MKNRLLLCSHHKVLPVKVTVTVISCFLQFVAETVTKLPVL